jgi:hypothetical protein
MLPDINIPFENGALGTFQDTPDGLGGFIISSQAVGSTFVLEKPYLVRSMAEVRALAITDSIQNHVLYKTLNEFYAEAGEGTAVWFMGVARTVQMDAIFTPGLNGKTKADILLDEVNGALNWLAIAFNPSTYTPTIVDGVDGKVWETKTLAQPFAVNYTLVKKAPFYVILEGYAFTGDGTALPDLNEDSSNRVGIALGDTETRTGSTASKGACIGLLMGRLARITVQRSPAAVEDGKLVTDAIYLVDEDVKTADIATLHDKRYITFRTITGKTGYFVTDAPLSASAADDYNDIMHRRVIDKAYRLAYASLIDKLHVDVDVRSNGTIDPIVAKSFEGRVIKSIYNQMTLNGELSRDKANAKDKGVLCTIDLTHNVVSSNTIKFAKLQVKSKAYGKYISVPLGFAPITNS